MSASVLYSDLDHYLPTATAPHWVAYSGGLDSTVLLHALCARLGADSVRAIHVHHGLSDQADLWAEQCADQCAQLGVALTTARADVVNAGHGLEAAARNERYRQFDRVLAGGGTLWLAHHLDDQLETFFLRLLRGSGLAGLSAMAAQRDQAGYRLVRPWLARPRSQLADYAHQHQLRWIDDPSNDDVHFDRNYLRQQVLPLLAERWPGYRQTVNRSINHLQQAAAQQQRDLDAELEHRLAADGAFKAVALDDWTDADVLALLHRWLMRQSVPLPSATVLQRVLDEVVRARVDAQPQVDFGGGSVRRFKTALYWVPDPIEPEPAPGFAEGESHWPGVGRLIVTQSTQGPNRLCLNASSLRWVLRQGGESFWPAGRQQRRDLKRLLQEYRLAPWLRDRLPLLYAGDQLVALAGLAIEQGFVAEEGEPGWQIHWQPSLSN
ncbi:tRNA lysidine(34) synthetase TilS [Saccharospirillum sp. MSK14-1]|uniref:tRNA lysidine(34) synthetase TilS n=1 Tax=Saccharospirillum sp. MSK14-1 TaxID=1897632 RepID=UPI000D373B77|nr:tRNA lysidine(34) synthetase TilS [Saccharospirillum sp. MSK14-1]PTY37169.1 tRNA lysidine(34) synthetase TilS [Saccharospirillum sp. MSK14-1]